MTETTDQIRKKVVLKAPRDRVWRAISDAKEFGSWFGVELSGAFSPGARIKAKIAPTKVDPDVARMQEPYSGTTLTSSSTGSNPSAFSPIAGIPMRSMRTSTTRKSRRRSSFSSSKMPRAARC